MATAYTSDSQGRAKLTLTVTPTSTGADWAASVSDGNSSYGGYASAAGSWTITVAGQTVASASGKSYDFGSNMISNPYFPRSASGSLVLSPGTYSASGTFSGDGSTVGTATIQSFNFTVTSPAPEAFTNTPYLGGTVGTSYSDYVKSVGATNITITSGSLPPGLSGAWESSTSGFRVTGTPTTAGSYSFTLTASNSSGINTTYNASITISGPPSATVPDYSGTNFNTWSSTPWTNAGFTGSIYRDNTTYITNNSGQANAYAGQSLTANSIQQVTSNMTVYYYQYVAVSYTVTFNANGGSGGPTSQAKASGVNLTLSSSQPTRTGYTFSSWNTSSNGSGTSYAPGSTYSADANVTLYAIWTPNTYTISFDANGGTGAPSSQTKTYGTSLTLSSAQPTRTDYSFTSWNTAANGSGTSYSPGGAYLADGDATLYAQWSSGAPPAVLTPKIWNGTSWTRSTSVKVWNGSAWVDGQMKIWNGTSWVDPT